VLADLVECPPSDSSVILSNHFISNKSNMPLLYCLSLRFEIYVVIDNIILRVIDNIYRS
jgi:hypothetical protein